MAELIGGSISLESTVGEGSRFTVRVPLIVDSTVSSATVIPAPY